MDDAPAPRPRLRDQLKWFGLALVGVALAGLLVGWLFAKGSPPSAAAAIIGQFVDEEPPGAFDADAPAPADAPPSSWGPHADGEVRCGVLDELSNADHLASLAAGVVVVRFRPDLPASNRRELEELAQRREVLVAPADGLEDVVQAFSWGRRLRLSAYNREFLRSFHQAYVDAPIPDVDVPLPPTCNGA